MTTETEEAKYTIKSFTCHCLVKLKDKDAFISKPSPQMCEFFGTTPNSYHDGILNRIRKDISVKSADMIWDMISKKALLGEPFRLVYPSMRADGTPCTIQLDAYPNSKSEDGYYFEAIGMDITELIKAKEAAERLSNENKTLLDDSPIGLGIYHIKDNKFDLVFVNDEYYHVHHGSREFWEQYKGKDAMERIYE